MPECCGNLNPEQIVNREEIARREGERLRNPIRRSKFYRFARPMGWPQSGVAPTSVGRNAGKTTNLAHALVLLCFAPIALALPFAAGTAEQPQLEIGVLTCNLAESEEANGAGDATSGPPIRGMVCVFRPTNSGPEEIYRGAVQIMGKDHDLPGGRAIIWIVKATPKIERSPGMLQQTYAADASAAPGHAPPLIGETNSSIILQTMADTPPLADKDKHPAEPSTIVLVALTLTSTPA